MQLIFKVIIIFFINVNAFASTLDLLKIFDPKSKSSDLVEIKDFLEESFFKIKSENELFFKFNLEKFTFEEIHVNEIKEFPIQIQYLNKQKISAPKVLRRYYVLNKDLDKILVYNDIEQLLGSFEISQTLSNKDIDDIKNTINNIKKKELELFSEKLQNTNSKADDLNSQFKDYFKKSSVQINSFKNDLTKTKKEFSNLLDNEKFKYIYLHKINIEKFQKKIKSLSSDFDQEISISNIDSEINKIQRYKNNEQLIREKLSELNNFDSKNSDLIKEISLKNSELIKLNDNRIQIALNKYKSSIDKLSDEILFTMDIDKLNKINLNNLNSYKNLISINESIKLKDIKKAVKKQNIKNKTESFFSFENNPAYMVIIFLVIFLLPIYICYKIIKKGLEIAEINDYSLIFSLSFVLNNVSLLVFIANYLFTDLLFNFSSLICIILFGIALFINYKKVGSKFIIFSLGQILSFVTIFIVVILFFNMMSKLFGKGKSSNLKKEKE